MVKKYLEAFIFTSNGTKHTLDMVGLVVSDMVKKRMTSLRTPPNSSFTQKRKGSSNPLIDTGILRASVTWATVTRRGRRLKV